MRTLESYITKETTSWQGIHRVYRFPNNYGAKMLYRDFSFGCSLKIVQFIEDIPMEIGEEVTTSLDGEELTNLSLEEVAEYLSRIKKFSPESI